MDMKFMRRIAKYGWQDYKTNEDILSELIINPAVQRQTATLNYKLSNRWEMKPRTTPKRLLEG